MLCTSKESLEHVELVRIKKYDNLKKKTIFEIFLIFIQREKNSLILNFLQGANKKMDLLPKKFTLF